MNRFQTILLIGVVTVSALATFLLWRQGQIRTLQSEIALREQKEVFARVAEAQRQLSNRLGNVRTTPAPDAAAEIARLRAKADALRRPLDAAGGKAVAQAPPSTKNPITAPEVRPPEYFAKLHRTAGAKTRDAMALGAALRQYAEDHQGQAPANTDQLGSYLGQVGMPVSGTNTFDVVYTGSLEALSKIPSSSVAVLRDRQIWTAPSGKPARVYGMSNGSALIVESDDDFASWEAEHIVSAPPGGR